MWKKSQNYVLYACHAGLQVRSILSGADAFLILSSNPDNDKDLRF